MNASCFRRSIMTLIMMIILPFHGSAEEVDLYELSLAQLGEVKVYTASRDLTSLEEAPAVMTVVIAANIRRQGAKTLRDVLDRVPGFFNQWDRNFSLIATRFSDGDLMISATYTESLYPQGIIIPFGGNQNSFQ